MDYGIDIKDDEVGDGANDNGGYDERDFSRPGIDVWDGPE
jgi:hypothetical protein